PLGAAADSGSCHCAVSPPIPKSCCTAASSEGPVSTPAIQMDWFAEIISCCGVSTLVSVVQNVAAGSRGAEIPGTSRVIGMLPLNPGGRDITTFDPTCRPNVAAVCEDTTPWMTGAKKIGVGWKKSFRAG